MRMLSAQAKPPKKSASACHQQTDGQAERVIQFIETYLVQYSTKHMDWDQLFGPWRISVQFPSKQVPLCGFMVPTTYTQ